MSRVMFWCLSNIFVIPFLVFGQSAQLHVPKDFSISVFSENLPKVRSMVFDKDGWLYATSNEGKVYRIDPKGQHTLIVQGLSQPMGIVEYKGDILVSSSSHIYRIKTPQIIQTPLQAENLEVLYDKLPSESWHGGKYMTVTGDWLLVNIGVPCNICQKKNPFFGNIVAFNLKQTPFRQYRFVARGIRNSVGFDQDPVSKDLFFSDNGQDNLGEDFPFDELNRVKNWGENFGFPYFANERSNKGYKAPQGLKNTLPVFLFPPHSAPLGIHFYRGTSFPKQDYQDSLFVALHGSWVRKMEPKSGYLVVVIKFGKDRKVESATPFVTGFLEGETTRARPVDIKEDIRGDLYISDDVGGKIYKIHYQGAKAVS